MNDLRLNGGQLCDAKLSVNGRQVLAHRLVLASSSSYFESVFTGENAVAADTVIPIESLDDEAFDAVLEFAYTKQIRIGEDNVQSLFLAADCLRFSGVLEACFKFQHRQLGTDNCLSMWQFARGHRDKAQELVRASKEIIGKNFVSLTKTDEFLALDVDSLVELVQDDDLAVVGEEQVYEAVMSWLRHDVDKRGASIAKALRPVRMQLLSRVYLNEVVDKEELIKSNVNSLQQLNEAVVFHANESIGGKRTVPLSVSRDGAVVPRRPSRNVEVSLLLLLSQVRLCSKLHTPCVVWKSV